ncbi:MAG: imidazolonepropionase [Alistipes sp.]|nr:imidazolonepropionase [Alistipes sp.]
MRLLVVNIGTIVGIDTHNRHSVAGADMDSMERVENGWLLAEDGVISGFGTMDCCPDVEDAERIDAAGGMLFPSYCDSHTHIVYAGSREQEFLDKIHGLSYEQIAARGGGILNSAERLHNTSEDELYRQAMERIEEIMLMGTGAVEIKSGYGLTTEDELKMLRVIARIKSSTPLAVKATFLGAHAVPKLYKGRQDEYVDLVCREMIPAVAMQSIAEFVDVFCDRGFFTLEQTRRIVECGAKYGLKAKIHANELDFSGGVQLGVELGAMSVDHLESSGAEEIECLRSSRTVATLLPGAALFLGMNYPPARAMVENGVTVALASDYNPGSSPSGNMRFVTSLASMRMRMTPTEALWAATLNGAAAMGLSDKYGSITVGKVANFFITKPLPSLEFFTYAYNTPLIERVVLAGKIVK